MAHFQVTVYEIPNPYIKRGTGYRKTYELVADNATEAKQQALDLFGDYSQVREGSCIQFDPDYPPVVEYAPVDDE